MLTAPIGEIVNLVPYNSSILDLGGGMGVIAEEIRKHRGFKSYSIVDIDDKRLTEVKKRLKDIETYPGDALDIIERFIGDRRLFETIIISDMLYLCDDSYTERLIIESLGLLKDNGILIIKEVDWNLLVKFQELLSVKLFRFTRGRVIHFRGVDYYEGLLKRHNLNFAILRFNRLWYPHFIITLRKQVIQSGSNKPIF
jgi:SAM-dependent methyltransferase